MKQLFRGSGFLLLAAFLLPGVLLAKEGKKKDKKAGSGGDTPVFNVPIPVDHDAQGIKLPYFDEKGKLQMSFSIGWAKRVDNNHLQMTEVKLETYDAAGKPEMSIDAPRSTLDLNTRIVTSDTPVTIRRSDFEVTGETMTFNTQTRGGVMHGKVRMLIFNKTGDALAVETK